MQKDYFEIQYYDALLEVLKTKTDREKVQQGEFVFAPRWRGFMPYTFQINLLAEGLPLLRGKKVFPKKALAELIWMLKGRNDLAYLHDYNVHYWDEFDLGDGTIGNSYGPRLRNLNGVDQIERVVHLLQTNPKSRQICISFWDPINDSEIRPCYSFIQFTVVDKFLNMIVTQRSGDALIGVPNDAIVFSFLVSLIAYYVNLTPGSIYYTVNNFHIYDEHMPMLNKYFEQYVGWREYYELVPIFTTRDFNLFENRASQTFDEFLDRVDEAYDFIYRFDLYKSRPFIKTPLLKQGKQ